ncbi:MAG: hypothetical protein LUQ67_04095 [Methanomicrobiales archaeon]|nr:hypothetical protein [Methanomicrobiales archaeon]
MTKNVLSQCNNQAIGKLSIENDLRAVDLFFGSRQELEELASLSPGEFFVMGGFVRKKTRIRFGPRETEHRGGTPELTRRQGPLPVPGRVAARPAPGRSRPVAAGRGGAPAVAPPAGLPGPAPVISREEAVALAEKRRRRGAILGLGKKRLVSVEPVGWPVARVRVRYHGGLLGRTVREATFLLDAVHGDLVRIHRGFSLRPGFAEVMGLPSGAVRVLTRLPLGGVTPAEAEVLSGLPRDSVKEALAALRERKLVTEAGRAGEAGVLVPLLARRLPALSSLKGDADPDPGPGSEHPLDARLTGGQVREVLKGMEPTAEVVSFALFSYPLYELVFSDGGRERRIYLDAVTGKEVAGAGAEPK